MATIRYPYELKHMRSYTDRDGNKVPRKTVLTKYFPETDTLYVLKIADTWEELKAYCNENSIDTQYIRSRVEGE